MGPYLSHFVAVSRTVAHNSLNRPDRPIEHVLPSAAGKPTFGTLIALLRDGSPVMGILDQPISKERWVGAAGRGTTLNGEASHLTLRQLALPQPRPRSALVAAA